MSAWDEIDWNNLKPVRPNGIPTLNELISVGEKPLFLLDVAVQHKGAIASVIFLDQIPTVANHFVEDAIKSGFPHVFLVKSSWVLNRYSKPEILLPHL